MQSLAYIIDFQSFVFLLSLFASFHEMFGFTLLLLSLDVVNGA